MSDDVDVNETSDTPFTPLLGAIITQMFNDSAVTCNVLISGLTQQRDTAEAQLDIIRERIEFLLVGPYMPTPDTLRSALWPSYDDIQDRVNRNQFREE